MVCYPDRIDKDFRIQTNVAEVNNDIELFEGWRRSPEECAQEARSEVIRLIEPKYGKYSNYPIDQKRIKRIIDTMKKEDIKRYKLPDDSLETRHGLLWKRICKVF